jgi:hypothetical protein
MSNVSICLVLLVLLLRSPYLFDRRFPIFTLGTDYSVSCLIPARD